MLKYLETFVTDTSDQITTTRIKSVHLHVVNIIITIQVLKNGTEYT